MGGGDRTTTQTSSNEPWIGAQDALKKTNQDAQNLYAGGIGGAIDTSSHVVPNSLQTTQALNAGTAMANANMGRRGASGAYQGIINNGGFNAPQMNAMRGMQQTANSAFNPFDNQGFGSVLRQAQEGAMNSVNMNAAGAGRVGSGMHEGAVAREVGNVTGGLMNNEYNNWQNRRSGAQSSLFNAGQAGVGNIGQAYQGMQAPLQNLRDIGGSYEDLNRRIIDDRTRVFDARNNMPWQQLQRLNAIASGQGSLGNTSSGTSTAPGQNPFGQIFGGLLGASGLFG